MPVRKFETKPDVVNELRVESPDIIMVGVTVRDADGVARVLYDLLVVVDD